MKKKLQEMLARKEARKAELIEKSKTSQSVEELRSINLELDALNGEIAELRGMIADIPDEPAPGNPEPAANPNPPAPEPRGVIPQPPFNPLGTYRFGDQPPGAGQTQRNTDLATMSHQEIVDSQEYRVAYLKRLQLRDDRLTDVDKRFLMAEAERRAGTDTSAGSAGAAVPTITYNKVIEKLRQYSVLFPLIQATYIAGNVTLPVANVLNAAQWTTQNAQGNMTDDNVVGVTLTGYPLAKYAQLSINVLAMTVDAFEAYVVDQMGKQLAIALENAILNGLGPTAGTPQPTGILPGCTWDASNSLNYSLTKGLMYDDFVNTKALLRAVYRPGAKWVFNASMEAAMTKIKSSTGFPLFSQDPQNGFAPKILGLPYEIDDYMPDQTILLGRFDYYFMNFPQAPVIEADKSAGFTTASVIYRGMLIGDGKPALDETFVKLTGA